MNIYYVYFYLRENYKPYYVGKGKNNRAWVKHENVETPKDKSRILIVEDNLSELNAFLLERYYIRWFGKLYNNSGILENITDGGEGFPALFGELNGMYGKSHTEEVKKKLAIQAKLTFKNKSYEDLYGKEKSDNLKLCRSEHMKGINNHRENNPRFDKTLYKFYNTNTKETFIGLRFDFYKKYNLHKGEVCGMIKHKTSHKSWIVID
jgi:hypothetical protein